MLIANLIILFYNLTWLVFLVQKHYGQVTTRAGHIFELNLQLQNTINTFLWTLLEYSRALDGWCTLRDILDGILFYGPWIATAGSQIETAIFLKTLKVNQIYNRRTNELGHSTPTMPPAATTWRWCWQWCCCWWPLAIQN